MKEKVVFIKKDVENLLKELKMKFRKLDTELRNEGELSGMEPILNVIGDQVLRIGNRFDPKIRNKGIDDIQTEFQILGDLFGQFIDENKKAWKMHPIYG